MKMIPAIIPNSLSTAETRIFQSLKMDNSPGTENWIVLHSLGVSKHYYHDAPTRQGKRYAEIDFLIITGQAIVVLEVKGGRVNCRNGMWSYTNRYNETTEKHESPFKQVVGGMFSLENILQNHFPGRRYRLCPGVLLSDMNRKDIPDTPEWEGRPLFTKDNWSLNNPVSGYVRQVISHSLRTDTNRYDGIDQARREELLNYLSPEIDCAPTLFDLQQDVDRETVRLTEAQYAILDFSKEKHLLIQGGAGSGKTFVAMEKARRCAQTGNATLYICSTPLFCSYLKQKINADFFCDDNLVLLSLEDIRNPESKYRNKFHTIILDEAQDFINNDIIRTLAPLTVNGLKDTEIFVFYDLNQIVNPDDFENRVLQGLITEYRFIRMQLVRNCRNTTQTVDGIQLYTGIRYPGGCLRDTSRNNLLRCATKVFANQTELKKAMNGALQGILEQGAILSKQITILYDNAESRENVINILNAEGYHFTELTRNGLFVDDSELIKIATAADYKGQENDYILYVVGAANENEADRNMVYLALSRAKIKPYLYVPCVLQQYFTRRMS